MRLNWPAFDNEQIHCVIKKSQVEGKWSLLYMLFIIFFKINFKMVILIQELLLNYYYPLAACMRYSVNTEASLDSTDDEHPEKPIKTRIILKIQQNIGI